LSLGCGETLKKGADNVRLILKKLEESDLANLGDVDKKRIYVTMMTVDQAATKTAAELWHQGLLFTIWCDLHCLSLVVDQSRVAFGGKPKRGVDHPEQVLFDIIHLIRVHVGIGVFFELVAHQLNTMLREFGAGGDLFITSKVLQSKMKLVDQAPGNRWEAKETVASYLMDKKKVLFGGPEYNAYRTRLPCTHLEVLVLGLRTLFRDHHHAWYSQPSQGVCVCVCAWFERGPPPTFACSAERASTVLTWPCAHPPWATLLLNSKDAELYGEICHVLHLRSLLTDPWMLSQVLIQTSFCRGRVGLILDSNSDQSCTLLYCLWFQDRLYCGLLPPLLSSIFLCHTRPGCGRCCQAVGAPTAAASRAAKALGGRASMSPAALPRTAGGSKEAAFEAVSRGGAPPVCGKERGYS
jgi:hypothetical protein